MERHPGVKVWCASVLVLLLFVPLANAAVPHLVRDINTNWEPQSSDANPYVTIAGTTYFALSTPYQGVELWKTDGTGDGTGIVKDIWPGFQSGFRTQETIGYSTYSPGVGTVANQLLFIGCEATHGCEPWVSDGSEAGTQMLVDATPGTANSTILFAGTTGAASFFTVGSNLWRTDGTPGGTTLVASLTGGFKASTPPRFLGIAGSKVFFRSTDGTNTGIFVSDGTAVGTHFVVSATVVAAQPFAGALYFQKYDAATQTWGLWRTDGTPEGTTLVRGGFTYRSGGEALVVAGGTLFFTASEPATGAELWRTDGTSAGTAIVGDITPGPASSMIGYMTNVDGTLFFFIWSGLTAQLWKSDGMGGAAMVKDGLTVTGGVLAFNHALYFGASDAAHGSELWRSDGTTAGTALLTETWPGPASGIADETGFVERADSFVFVAADPVHGRELWISDGTAAGTRLLKNLRPERPYGSNPQGLAAVNGKAMFLAAEGTIDSPLSSLWSTDGTDQGTTRIRSGVDDLAQPTSFASSGDLYFFEQGAIPSMELWRSDGTVAGTYSVFRMAASRYIDAFVPFRGGLFFAGDDGVHGAEPWFSDGSVAGTAMIADVYPGTGSSFPYANGPAASAAQVYFGADGLDSSGAIAGVEPWKTDGTAAGTKLIADATPGSWSTSPQAFTDVNGTIFFASYLNDSAFDLWRTDGTAAGTVLVKHFDGLRAPAIMFNVGGRLFFIDLGQLWTSDGTAAGTQLIATVPGPTCFEKTNFAVAGRVLYWFETAARELWRSDGTVAGTTMVYHFDASWTPTSMQSCTEHPLINFGGLLYFTGMDNEHGAEPWVSDGTTAGTHMLYDVNPGAADSNPEQWMRAGRTLYFTADDGSHGTELWAYAVDLKRGDVNGDGAVSPPDVFYLVNHLFAAGQEPLGSGDANADGQLNAADVFFLIEYLFAGGPAPAV